MAKDKWKVDQGYIELSYAQAIREYQTATTEKELDKARREMARLEQIAMQDHGFDYADWLAKKKEDIEVRNIQ